VPWPQDDSKGGDDSMGSIQCDKPFALEVEAIDRFGNR
jgi:hypothetical protein